MTRPKKEDGPNKNAQITISVDDFMRTRDNVVTSLTTLQGAIGDLLRAYMNHTTSIIGGMPGSELTTVTANILTAAAGIEGEEPPAQPKAKAKKQKVRRKKDPNAPKAPPTAYFLYAQQARPLIKTDLGEGAKGDAVTMEASKRWNALSDPEKEVWRLMYKENFAKYKTQMAVYNAEKAARGEAVEEEEPLVPGDLDEEGDAVAAAVPDEEEEEEEKAESESSSSSSDSESEEEAPPPPPKVETPAKKRGKGAKANGVSGTPKQTPVPLPTPQAAEKTKSPEKRKKGAAGPAEVAEEPKKKKGKKGKAAEVVEEEEEEETVEAPAMPVEKKRKRKGDAKA